MASFYNKIAICSGKELSITLFNAEHSSKKFEKVQVLGSFSHPVWSPNGRYLACIADGALSVYSAEGGLNSLKMCSSAKRFSFSPRDSWLVAEYGDERMIVINMATHTNSIFTLGARYSSSIWSNDEAFLVVHCEGSNELRFFARETSDIFTKNASLEKELNAQLSVGETLRQMLRETLLGKPAINF